MNVQTSPDVYELCAHRKPDERNRDTRRSLNLQADCCRRARNFSNTIRLTDTGKNIGGYDWWSAKWCRKCPTHNAGGISNLNSCLTDICGYLGNGLIDRFPSALHCCDCLCLCFKQITNTIHHDVKILREWSTPIV